MKLYFSGEWILNRQASGLNEGAAAIESGVMWIIHDGPKCGFRINMKAGGESVERTWESSFSDQREVAAGGSWSHLFWDGDAMVFNCGSESPGSSWAMSWRYELTADRLGLHAIEQMRGAGRDFENTWIFERKQT